MHFLFILLIATTLQAAPTSQPQLQTQDLFEAGEHDYTTYRIPSLFVTHKGTALLTCSARADAISDWADIDILLRRSTDAGRTWQPPQKLVDDKKNTCDNATLFAAGNRVFVMYQINYAKAYLIQSDDEGLTWSAPRDVTSVFETYRSRDHYDWQVIAMGPGHGTTLRTGRILVPVWLSTSHSHRPSITSTIFSDDQGTTWQAGDVVTQNLPESKNPSENAVIELADGRVMNNIRCESDAHRRLIAYSPDGATHWTKPAPDEHLFEPICFASITRFQSHLFFCNPDSEKLAPVNKKTGAYPRKNLTLRLSDDEGQTWPISKVIEPGESGYSDLAVTPDGTILLAYERGGTKGEKVFAPRYLSLARFKSDWLTGAKDP